MAVEHIEIHYTNAKDFKTLYSNGAWGGITPKGMVSIAFYQDRMPGAAKTRFPVKETPDGLGLMATGPEETLVEQNFLERQNLVEMVLSMEDAINLREWLNSVISDMPAKFKG